MTREEKASQKAIVIALGKLMTMILMIVWTVARDIV